MDVSSLPFDPADARFLVGLEIHQQLATSKKLFCSCPIVKSEEFPRTFERRLRPTQSELGHIDPAAVFEFNKAKANLYKWNPESSCLVEADDEPPHSLNEQALETTVLLSMMLHSHLVDEVHVMRKIVIDGSNTSGFQRTAVVGLGGTLHVGDQNVGVQAVTLEEDAARILGEDDRLRHFALDRLGVPLVEIALNPVVGDPVVVERVALSLGRALRSSGKVARGLGTIRQDLNISLMGGEVIEVKGVQKLNLLGKVIAYEAIRQMGLIKVAEELKEKRGIATPDCRILDITEIMSSTQATVLKRVLQSKGVVYCITCRGLAGMMGREPFPGVRLGKELAEVARANSLGGIIHSDEFRRQKIEEAEESKIREAAGATPEDALVIVAGDSKRVQNVSELIKRRLEVASLGVPSETRAATDEGETRYMRPRPGPARLYPETDVPELAISDEMKAAASALLPDPWEETVRSFASRNSLNEQLALQIYDEDKIEEFEKMRRERPGLQPSVVAELVIDLPRRLQRELSIDDPALTSIVGMVAAAVNDGLFNRDVAFEVSKLLASGEATDVDDAMKRLNLGRISDTELSKIIDEAVAKNKPLIAEKGDRALSVLMGDVMKKVRGNVDGERVSKLLKERIERS